MNKYYKRLKKLIRILNKTIFNIIIDFLNISIVMIDGGLGSQIFKYAFILELKNRRGGIILSDLSWFDKCGKSIDQVENRYFQMLYVFPNIKIKKAPYFFVKLYKKYGRIIHNNDTHFYSNEIFYKNAYFDDYYINKELFNNNKEKLLYYLDFNNDIKNDVNNISKYIIEYQSLCIHVRRGDYVGSMHDVVDIDYYKKALNTIFQKVKIETIIIFSNDSEWVNKYLLKYINNSLYKIIVQKGDNDTGFHDMYLMSLCKHFIITNSSFSWIPAWISNNNNKLIIMPSDWYNNIKIDVNKALGLKRSLYI